MSLDLAAILKAIEQIIALEQQAASAIATEHDLARRAKLLKALQDRDLKTIREMLFEVG